MSFGFVHFILYKRLRSIKGRRNKYSVNPNYNFYIFIFDRILTIAWTYCLGIKLFIHILDLYC